jgi:hypothetical protein
MFRWLFNKELNNKSDDFIIIETTKEVETKEDYDCRFFTDDEESTEESNEESKESNEEIIETPIQLKLKTQLDSRIDPVIFVPGHPFEIIPNYEEDELENIFRKTIGFLFNRFTNIMVEEFTNDHFTA